MKPPPFDYLRATSLDEVWDALDSDDDVKVIAGGQSLVPLLSLRFASPSLLVDITALDELGGISTDGDVLRVGALSRHVQVEKHPLILDRTPLLARAASWVAHAQIRNRGTFGGSVAHSDSAAEFPAALLALDATMIVRSRAGERRVRAADFFHAYFTTALTPTELLTAVEVPIARSGSSWGFEEFARRRGDYAIGGAAVYVERDPDDTCRVVRAGLLAAGPAPCLAPRLEDVLVGNVVDAGRINDAVRSAMARVNPGENVHGASEYRRDVIGEMLRRALASAFNLEEVA
ncbi:xanthine dehydrogenase family protein subunit M [Nocardioides sp. JQ2195]|uniref:FAD binding domain-containing protein n=1 Tax=Nocardioides sp. JQ2195 TaxID=2592334 RepID=UPI00143E3914|nr:xanthine dehydrogenase family protein subunit M [Nocardioides sp. JQ2195]QIX26963.1 xanthine dehydrogenase family protein subunit M [Nocardioides sp. JQ2195]